ncbi:MAG: CHAT domain-containing protein [Nitrososphaeria archaeon]
MVKPKTIIRFLKKIIASEREELELWNEIRSRNPEYASLRVTETISLEEVQELLDGNSALIEYYARRGGKSPIVVFVATKDSFSCIQLDLSVIELWKMIFDPIVGKPVEPSRENLAWLSEVLGQLYIKLFYPIEQMLIEHGIQKIYFCPHGLLHLFPLHAMYKETEYGRHYIIEDYAVAYTPSASVLRHCIRKKREKRDSLLAIKNPDGTLVYADLEVDAISKLYSKHAILDRVTGVKKNVIAKAKEYDVVHFACHGLFRGDIPQMSGLKLADGWFTMIDILNNLQLNASQVILSSCQTGKSKQEGGDEVIGLTRAFLYAGAPSVIASLWSVDDESTSILFQRYHTYLIKGFDKAESLRKAQIDTMNYKKEGVIGRPFSHPYFWGPFCLVGGSRF